VILVRVVVNAVGLLVAGLLVPGIEIAWSDDAEGIALTLLALALVFGLVNASIGSLARLVSLPINLLTMGLFSILVNAALLLLVAWITDRVWGPLIVLGGFPPDLSIEALVAAAAGALVIGLISALMAVLIPRR
jgi:putative membrane protein